MGLAPAGFHERLLPAIFCSPKKRDAKRCSLASCNRSICTSLYVKGSPPRACFRCQSRLPGSVRATSCGTHLDWPSLANRPFQSQLTAARVKGTWPLGSLGNAQLARCRHSRRAVTVPPFVPPEHRRPGRIRPAGAGQGWPALAARMDASANPRSGREAQEKRDDWGGIFSSLFVAVDKKGLGPLGGGRNPQDANHAHELGRADKKSLLRSSATAGSAPLEPASRFRDSLIERHWVHSMHHNGREQWYWPVKSRLVALVGAPDWCVERTLPHWGVAQFADAHIRSRPASVPYCPAFHGSPDPSATSYRYSKS